MKFRVCLLSIFFCLFAAVSVDAGQNSKAVISLDYVASGQGNQTDDGVISGTVSGRGTNIVVEVFAKNVSTSLSAVEILFKSSSRFDLCSSRKSKHIYSYKYLQWCSFDFCKSINTFSKW